MGVELGPRGTFAQMVRLAREMDLLTMQREIDSMARDEMDRSQREYYLRHQMKAIMSELGEGNEIVEEIGGGMADGKNFKAAQTGGPSGGCIPAEHLDTPVSYETLVELGTFMG